MTDYLADSPVVVTVDGFTFNAVDDNDVTWTVEKLSGWHDGPSVDVELSPRLVSHGLFAQPGRRGGRTITMSGTLSARTHGRLTQAAQSLATILADGGYSSFEVDDAEHGIQWTPVQLLETPDMSWDAEPLTLKYQLSFLAPSAYKYGLVSSASTAFADAAVGAGLVFPLFPDGVLDFGPLGEVGQAAVTNHGTAYAPVKFTISGPTPTAGFVIRDTVTGDRIQYLGQVSTGSELVIDTGAGSAIIDGTADRLGDCIVDNWPTIAPGATRAFLFEPNGSPTASTLTASVVATYW